MLSFKPIPIRKIEYAEELSVEEHSSTDSSYFDEEEMEKIADLDEPQELSLEDEVDELERERQSLMDEKASFDNMRAEWLVSMAELKETSQKEGYDLGYQEGREVGYQEGYQQITREMNDYVQEIRLKQNQINLDLQEYIEKLQPIVLRIIEESVEALIYEQLKVNPDHHLNLIKKAISMVAEEEQVILKVSRPHYEWLKEKRESLIVDSSISDFLILIDDSLEAFDIQIEAGETSLDFSLKVQLDNWKQELRRMGATS